MTAQPETASAVSATVEPASSDDWEVVEQNAAYMEEQLLNQARPALLQQQCSAPLSSRPSPAFNTLRITAA